LDNIRKAYAGFSRNPNFPFHEIQRSICSFDRTCVETLFVPTVKTAGWKWLVRLRMDDPSAMPCALPQDVCDKFLPWIVSKLEKWAADQHLSPTSCVLPLVPRPTCWILTKVHLSTIYTKQSTSLLFSLNLRHPLYRMHRARWSRGP